MLLLPETLNVNSPSTLSTSLKAVFRSIVYGEVFCQGLICDVAFNHRRVVYSIHGDFDRCLVSQCAVGDGVSDSASPLKFSAGVKTSLPSTTSTVPCSLGTETDSILSLSPSTSVSFGRTSIVTAVSFLYRSDVIFRHWRIVDRCHIDFNGGGFRHTARGDDVGESIFTDVVIIWCVSHAAVRIDRDRAVGWAVIGIERHHFTVAFERVVT